MLNPGTPTVACDLPDAGCVEATLTDTGHVEVRDTKNLDLEPLTYTPREWREFTAAVKTGRFDLPGDPANTTPCQSVRRVLSRPVTAFT